MMDTSASSERRVQQLRQQLAPIDSRQQPALESAPCAVHHRSLPRFDVTFMEHYLETDRGLKNEVYDLFKQHPELLYAVEEGMTKGERFLYAVFLQTGTSSIIARCACRATQTICTQAAPGYPLKWIQSNVFLHERLQEILLHGRAACSC